MYPETEAFLRGLFGHCGGSGQPAFLTLSAIHPSGNLPTPSRHIPLGDTSALAHALGSLMVANKMGWGAYVGVAPRRANLGRWARGGKDNLVELPALFIDADDPSTTLPRLRAFDLPPSCLVSSGRGIHAYWYLREPTKNFAVADRALRGLAEYFGSDQHMTIAQSMRLVGTRNTKAGRADALCQLVDFHPQRLYDLEDFSPYTQSAQRKYEMRHLDRSSGELLAAGQNQQAIRAITDVLLRRFDGHEKRNGWIGALCPCGHVQDRPGKHFNWHPTRGIAVCFGRHGRLSLSETCGLLGI